MILEACAGWTYGRQVEEKEGVVVFGLESGRREEGSLAGCFGEGMAGVQGRRRKGVQGKKDKTKTLRRERERGRERGSCEGELMRGFTRVASRIALLVLRLEFLVRGRVGRDKELAFGCGSLPASGGDKRR
ncbi:hypothetical protein MA16_Dca018444 [Dendrobium catenatum]|uniref:Uncharacterized protein n=1 Tax=Dendrobium catenatum TaxID=906689 RepID=A0A2I0XF93_9ASPA|nr:hypothetical protein MA16_Dca018444 [Dendrobium catenatum]